MVSWMMDTTKPKKVVIATTSLANIQLENTLHCWGCSESSHIKGDSNCCEKKIS